MSGIEAFIGYGIASGITDMLRGGSFSNGFMSAGISGLLGAKIAPGTAWGNALGCSGRFVVQTIAGGTVSLLTGGKFVNGAMTAAFAAAMGKAAASDVAPGTGGDGAPANRFVTDADGKLVYSDEVSGSYSDCNCLVETSDIMRRAIMEQLSMAV